MATLHVRNVPEKLYKRIQKLAQIENRSLTAEVNPTLSTRTSSPRGTAG